MRTADDYWLIVTYRLWWSELTTMQEMKKV